MNVSEAREIARQWVKKEAIHLPGFAGAWLLGSLNWLPDDAELTPATDADIRLVFEDSSFRDNAVDSVAGKSLSQGLIVEISFGLLESVVDPERVLGNLDACAFAAPCVLSDPSGILTRVQQEVSREYARLEWVLRRCDYVKDVLVPLHLERMLASPGLPQQIHEFLWVVLCYAFIIHLSGLRLPTLRKSLVRTREILSRYDKLYFQEVLLRFLGADKATEPFARKWLDELGRVFVRAVELKRTPFPIHKAVSQVNEPIAIGGSREIMDAGLSRESLFWILAMRTHCQWVFENDAQDEEKAQHMREYRELLAGFRLGASADLADRQREAADLIDRLMEVAKDIIASNPRVEQ